MPNVKIYVDDTVLAARGAEIRALLPTLRDRICAELSVPLEAAQVAVLPVIGLSDQPLANLEFQYLATAERSPDMIRRACAIFRDLLAGAIGSTPAVRATPLDPQTYVALK